LHFAQINNDLTLFPQHRSIVWIAASLNGTCHKRYREHKAMLQSVCPSVPHRYGKNVWL